MPRRGPAVLACNHVSYLDWLLLPLVVRTRRSSFLAKQEYFTEKGWRGTLKRSWGSSRRAHGSHDGRLNRGRTGIARLAAETGVVVIPCATVGLFSAAPVGARLPRPRKVAVRFGTPMTFPAPPSGQPTAQELRAWTDQLMAAIRALSGQASADCP